MDVIYRRNGDLIRRTTRCRVFAVYFTPLTCRLLARAFKSSLDLAKASQGRLLLLHVVPPPQALVLADVPPPADLYVKWDVQARASAQLQLERLVRPARRAGIRATILLTNGPVADRIIAVARRTKVDVIVVGTHGRTGLARAFVDSIAGRVVATASRPVLTIRGR
jgi:nucleotide-binding universal stress UspA family protein